MRDLGLGPYELMIIGFVALHLFGRWIPEVLRNLGRGVGEFTSGFSRFDPHNTSRRNRLFRMLGEHERRASELRFLNFVVFVLAASLLVAGIVACVYR